MNFFYTKANIIRGALIYCIGDTLATLISGDFNITRMFGIAIMGGTMYAFEIPNFLLWLNDKDFGSSLKAKWTRTILFTLYFNPLWIARHVLLLELFSGNFEKINWDLLNLGWDAFLYPLPIVIPANYIISNIIPYKWRFVGSTTFSGIMAIYYAVAPIIFA